VKSALEGQSNDRKLCEWREVLVIDSDTELRELMRSA